MQRRYHFGHHGLVQCHREAAAAWSASWCLGWTLAWLTGLVAADRRAVAIEVAFQNVAFALGIGIAFFPSLAGVAAVSILWGIVHLALGSGLAFAWRRVALGSQH